MIRAAALLWGLLGFLLLYAPFAARMRSRRPASVFDGPEQIDAALMGGGPLEDNFFNNYIRPLLRSIKPESPLGAFMRARGGSKARTLLIRSGNPLRITPFEFFGLQMMGTAGGLIGGLVLATAKVVPPWACIGLGLLLGFFGPKMYHTNLRDNRERTVRREFPEALDLLVITMSSGRNFVPALTEVSSRMPDGLTRAELSRVSGELNGGKPLESALMDLAERAPTDGVESFCKSVVQGEAIGADIIETLRAQSEAARTAYEAAIDNKTAKLNQTLVIPVMVFMVPALMAVLIGPALGGLSAGFAGTA